MGAAVLFKLLWWLLFSSLWQNAWQKKLKEGLPWLTVCRSSPSSGGVMVAGAWSGWSHGIHSEEAERSECWHSAHFLFLFSLGWETREWYPHLHEFTLKTSLTDVLKGWPLSESRSHQVDNQDWLTIRDSIDSQCNANTTLNSTASTSNAMLASH